MIIEVEAGAVGLSARRRTPAWMAVWDSRAETIRAKRCHPHLPPAQLTSRIELSAIVFGHTAPPDATTPPAEMRGRNKAKSTPAGDSNYSEENPPFARPPRRTDALRPLPHHRPQAGRRRIPERGNE